MCKSNNGTAKQAYQSPKLTVYGTVRDLTKKVAAGGNSDHVKIGTRTLFTGA
jgi:hypothetical protein